MVVERVDRLGQEARAVLGRLLQDCSAACWLLGSHTVVDLGPLVPRMQLVPVAKTCAQAFLHHALPIALSPADLDAVVAWTGGEPAGLGQAVWRCEMWGPGAPAAAGGEGPWSAESGEEAGRKEGFEEVAEALVMASMWGETFDLSAVVGAGGMGWNQAVALRQSCWVDPVWEQGALRFSLSPWVRRLVRGEGRRREAALERMRGHAGGLPTKVVRALVEETMSAGQVEHAMELGGELLARGVSVPAHALEAMVAQVEGAERLVAHAPLVLEHARRTFGRGEYAQTLAQLERLEGAAVPDRVQVEVHRLRGSLARVSASPQLALQEYDQAIKLGEGEGGAAVVGVLEMERAAALWESGACEDAIEELELGLGVQREGGDRRSEGVVVSNLGVMLHHVGRHAEAEAHHLQALAIHREVGHRRFEGIALFDLGTLYFERGALELARDRCTQALAILGEVGDGRGVLLSKMVLASLGQALGQEAFEEAWEGEVAPEDLVLGQALALYGQLAQLQRTFQPVEPSSPQDTFADEVRLPARLIQRTTWALTHHEAIVLRQGDAYFSRGHGAPEVDLSRHAAHQHIFGALIKAHLWQQPPLGLEALVEAGWPGEQVTPGAAKNRVHVALSALRSAGLKDAIVHVPGGGWALKAGLCVWRVA